MKTYGFRASRGVMLRKQAALQDAIEAARVESAQYQHARRRAGRPPHVDEWVTEAREIPTAQLSLLALEWAARPRDEPIKRYAAALELGEAIAPKADKPVAVAVGLQVASLVSGAGIIEDLSPPLGKARDKSPLTLAPDVLASIEHLMDAAPAKPLIAQPTDAPRVKKSWKGHTEPATPGPRVAEALDAIRGTRWAINPHMLAVLTKLYPTGRRSRLKPTERAALHTAGTLSAPFYLGGHFDWRGRYYQDGLNGLQWTSATDLTRSLLQFADGFPINHVEGLPFLKLHITSTYGYKGADAQRWQWVDDNQVRILALADNPASTSKFWRGAKERYRFLAACYAYRDVLAGNPVHLPCSFDVTCSGVGIYALLTRDENLGRLVGLLPGGSVPDFYAHVGALCDPPATREAVKEVVVPAMYGQGVNRPNKIRSAMWKAMGPAARQLFDWLRTQGAADSVLAWDLPDGFTVAQDYRKIITSRLAVRSGRRLIRLEDHSPGWDFDSVKSARSTPANFIQSWDGAYLRAVVRLGRAMGIPSWGVAHDCFSVHAAFAQPLVTVALQYAAVEVFGPDRLAALGWGDEVPGARGVLDWRLGYIVG